MPIEIEKVKKHKQFKALEKTLDNLKSEVMEFIENSKDEEYAVKRLAAINKKLGKTTVFSVLEGRRKCPDGTVYDPVSDTCI